LGDRLLDVCAELLYGEVLYQPAPGDAVGQGSAFALEQESLSHDDTEPSITADSVPEDVPEPIGGVHKLQELAVVVLCGVTDEFYLSLELGGCSRVVADADPEITPIAKAVLTGGSCDNAPIAEDLASRRWRKGTGKLGEALRCR